MSDPIKTPSPRRRFSKRTFFFGVCAILLLCILGIAFSSTFSSCFAYLGGLLSPILIGCVIAYLCNPILKFFEFVIFHKLRKGNLKSGLSLLCTALTAIGIIALVLALIIPELIESITQLIANYQVYLTHLLEVAQSIIDKMELDVDISTVEKFTELLEDLFGSVNAAVSKILQSFQGSSTDESLFGNIWGFVMKLFDALLDIVLGIFIAFYILSSKAKRKAQISKFRAAYFTDAQNEKITEVAELVNRTFSAYVRGVLLDALVVGVLMFLFLSIFRISEYALLIAAICAVTNIIPVFGPFIGAIPSGLIVLISTPEKTPRGSPNTLHMPTL